jgi:hypothetical protein
MFIADDTFATNNFGLPLMRALTVGMNQNPQFVAFAIVTNRTAAADTDGFRKIETVKMKKSPSKPLKKMG